jgi:type III pantothenate kinase
MTTASSQSLVAVDVGNSRIKFGEFERPLAEPLPHPVRAISFPIDWTDRDLKGFLPRDPASYNWSIASVNRPAAARLTQWLQSCQAPRVQSLGHADLPLAVDLPRPDLVGVDRLANAVAANRLRGENQPALVIDFGSAVTVDLISESGAFAGGAILPGIAMAARALHTFTDLLPEVEVTESPPALGKSTRAAISSGLFWGTLGAVRELIAQLSAGTIAPQVFLTGGAAAEFAAILAGEDDNPPQFVPHLTLAGIALAALSKLPANGSQ